MHRSLPIPLFNFSDKDYTLCQQRVILNGEHAKTKFALRASEVICDSEVHFVSEVSPNGEVMANLTSLRACGEQLHCA